MDKTTKPQADGYFGVCPECHNNDGFLDVGRDHWFYCEEHKTCWWVGSNLFSSWCEQTEEGKQANIKFLAGCKIVEPVWPENTLAENAAKKETKYPPSQAVDASKPRTATQPMGNAPGSAGKRVCGSTNYSPTRQTRRTGTLPVSGAPSIHDSMLAAVPGLRVVAMSLCRNVDRADDLVQETLLRALAHIDSFQAGTNLPAWLFTILRNVFRTEYRKRLREVEDIDGSYAETLTTQPEQTSHLDFQDFLTALDWLPVDQREALILVGACGYSYGEAAKNLRLHRWHDQEPGMPCPRAAGAVLVDRMPTRFGNGRNQCSQERR